MVRIFGILVLILSIVLFPPATLALVSNNALPGEPTYPIKRALENGILAIASLNLTTKAWFSVERSNRRFYEATTLLRQGKEAEEVLNELVEQTALAAEEIKNIKDENQKREYIQKLAEDIKKYTADLEKIAEKQEMVSGNQIVTTPQPSLIPQTPSPAASSIRPTLSSSPSLKPSPSISLKPPSLLPSPSLSPSPSPRLSPSPSPIISPSPSASPLPGGSSDIRGTIDDLIDIGIGLQAQPLDSSDNNNKSGPNQSGSAEEDEGESNFDSNNMMENKGGKEEDKGEMMKSDNSGKKEDRKGSSKGKR